MNPITLKVNLKQNIRSDIYQCKVVIQNEI